MKSTNLKLFAESLLSLKNSQDYIHTPEIQEFCKVLTRLNTSPQTFANLLLTAGPGLGLPGSYSDWFEEIFRDQDLLGYLQKLEFLSLGMEMKIGQTLSPQITPKKSRPSDNVRIKIRTWPATERVQDDFNLALAKLTCDTKRAFLGKIVILGLVPTRKGSKSFLSTEYALLEKFEYGGLNFLNSLVELTNDLWGKYLSRQAQLGMKFLLIARLRQFDLKHFGIDYLSDKETQWLLAKLDENESTFIYEAEQVFSPLISSANKERISTISSFPGGIEAMDALRHKIYGDDIN